jgi:hypothetical protein
VKAAARPLPMLRALAYLAATFAVVFAALLPSAVSASARHDRPIVLCSAEGPRAITVGPNGERSPEALKALKCAACVMAAQAALPPPPAIVPAAPPAVRPETFARPVHAALPPPARAPPRPPSTAPPHA